MLRRGTTGGSGGATTTVSDLASLRAALEGDAPKVIIVSSIISGDGQAVDVGANTTVYCDAASGMEGSGFRIKAVSNVIVSRLLSPSHTRTKPLDRSKTAYFPSRLLRLTSLPSKRALPTSGSTITNLSRI